MSAREEMMGSDAAIEASAGGAGAMSRKTTQRAIPRSGAPNAPVSVWNAKRSGYETAYVIRSLYLHPPFSFQFLVFSSNGLT